MNEWVIAGLVVVGTLIAAGGGGLISGLFNRKQKPSPPKPPA